MRRQVNFGKRECEHPRTRHEHGTRAAYVADRCRCFPCSVASSVANEARDWSDGLVVEDIGAVRRIQALSAAGWSTERVAAAAALPTGTVFRIRETAGTGRRLQVRVDACIRRAYDALSVQPNPVSRGANRIRNHAAVQGWAPPLAWDEDSIDDPTAQPIHTVPDRTLVDKIAVTEVLVGRPVRLHRPERVEVTRIGTSRGMSAEQIAQHLGVSERAVTRYRAEVAA